MKKLLLSLLEIAALSAAAGSVYTFPANNFKGQESGTYQKIQPFCSARFNILFPMFGKISAKESDKKALQPQQKEEHMEKATFAAGCFWGVESAFRTVDGVVNTQVGYTGGTTENPTYQDVCSGQTGHAEAVEITFDPSKITYRQLVGLFWRVHNPTQVNRQGPDTGTQYRSAIFFQTLEQKEIAEKSKAALESSGKYQKPLSTKIVPAGPFYRAEEYHQRYFEKNGGPICHFFSPV